jgi:hypothetical protein
MANRAAVSEAPSNVRPGLPLTGRDGEIQLGPRSRQTNQSSRYALVGFLSRGQLAFTVRLCEVRNCT